MEVFSHFQGCDHGSKQCKKPIEPYWLQNKFCSPAWICCKLETLHACCLVLVFGVNCTVGHRPINHLESGHSGSRLHMVVVNTWRSSISPLSLKHGPSIPQILNWSDIHGMHWNKPNLPRHHTITQITQRTSYQNAGASQQQKTLPKMPILKGQTHLGSLKKT